jgi:hypothetical protein
MRGGHEVILRFGLWNWVWRRSFRTLNPSSNVWSTHETRVCPEHTEKYEAHGVT